MRHRVSSLCLLACLAGCDTATRDADTATVAGAAAPSGAVGATGAVAGTDTPTAGGTASPAGESPAPSPSGGPGATPARCAPGAITGDGVGAVRIDMSVTSLRAACAIARDATVPADEGTTARVLYVPLGRDTVEAEVDVGKVWRIGVRTTGLRTADGLGAGTPLSRLVRFDGARGIAGEGRLFVTVPAHCGLSFQLPPEAARQLPAGGDRAALRRLPQDARVSRVLVIGCKAAGG